MIEERNVCTSGSKTWALYLLQPSLTSYGNLKPNNVLLNQTMHKDQDHIVKHHSWKKHLRTDICEIFFGIEVVKKNPSSFWFKIWLHPPSPFPHTVPFTVAAVTYDGVIVKQCIAQCGTISHVCFLTSALLPPGTASSSSCSILPSLLLPNRGFKDASCLRTAPFINER